MARVIEDQLEAYWYDISVKRHGYLLLAFWIFGWMSLLRNFDDWVEVPINLMLISAFSVGENIVINFI